VRAAAAQAGCGVTRIGTVDAEPGLRLVDAAGRALKLALAGYDHFRDA
jgi:thiamine-monophosphate kinase